MSHLSEIYIKAETLKTLSDTVTKKGEKGISITVSTSDNANEWGQNVSAFVAQSKEDREVKKPKFYVGNGKTFWSDGKPPFVPKKEQAHTPKQEYSNSDDNSGDLPF